MNPRACQHLKKEAHLHLVDKPRLLASRGNKDIAPATLAPPPTRRLSSVHVVPLRVNTYVSPLVIQLPIGFENTFEGVVDLLSMKAYKFEGKMGENVVEIPVPDALKADAEKYRGMLIEKIVEQDDALMSAYLDGKEPSMDELKATLRKAVIANKIFERAARSDVMRHVGDGNDVLLIDALAVLLVPFAPLAFGIVHWKRAKKPFLLYALGAGAYTLIANTLLVAVPLDAPDLRRHWHRGCWDHRLTRAPRR